MILNKRFLCLLVSVPYTHTPFIWSRFFSLPFGWMCLKKDRTWDSMLSSQAYCHCDSGTSEWLFALTLLEINLIMKTVKLKIFSSLSIRLQPDTDKSSGCALPELHRLKFLKNILASRYSCVFLKLDNYRLLIHNCTHEFILFSIRIIMKVF